MKKYAVLLLLLSSCTFSCRHKQEQREVKFPYTISLEREISRVNPVGLSEVGNQITYIPFETSDSCLIGGLRYRKGVLTFSNSHIALHDIREVFLFDLSGKFIRKIGRKGQGPGEFAVLLHDLCFSLDGSKLFLVESRRIHEYNTNGEFIGTFTYPSVAMQRVIVLNENHYVVYFWNDVEDYGGTKESFIIIDSQNNIVNSFKNYNKMIHKHSITIDNPAPLYSFQSNVIFKEMTSDTLQMVTENELLTYAVFDFGNKRMPILDLPLPYRGADGPLDPWLDNYMLQNGHFGKYFLSAAYEDVDNLYFELSNIREYLYGYYSKHTSATKVIGKTGFQNDIDGGLPFFPRYVYNDSILVDMVDAYKLREHVLKSNATEMKRKFGKNWDDLLSLVNNLEEDANQVLVMVKK